MKLEYNILWIENEEDFVDSSIPKVEEILTDRGFEPIITKVVDESKVDNYLNVNYDLIISDFQLNDDVNGKNGAEVIYELRNEKKLDTEILFYSDKVNYLEDDFIRTKLAFMERINIQQGRGTLLDKIEKVVELTLKKLLELNATRGLITAATSELDVEIEEIYYQLIEIPVDAETKLKLEKIFKTDYKEMQKNYLKQCKAKRDNHASDFKRYFSISDSFRKYDILKELLKLKTFDNFDLTLFKRYKGEVIEIRNKFAHAKAIDDNGTQKLVGQFGQDGFEFTVESCVEIRKNLIAHKRNIETLRQTLNNNL